MSKKYVVRLSQEEREELQSLVKKGTVKAYRVKHANILLKAGANGPGWTDEKIADAFGCHFNTVRSHIEKRERSSLASFGHISPKARKRCKSGTSKNILVHSPIESVGRVGGIVLQSMHTNLVNPAQETFLSNEFLHQ